MPPLKGSNPKAKTSVYNVINKPKKPGRKEQQNRRLNMDMRLQQDERESELNDNQPQPVIGQGIGPGIGTGIGPINNLTS